MSSKCFMSIIKMLNFIQSSIWPQKNKFLGLCWYEWGIRRTLEKLSNEFSNPLQFTASFKNFQHDTGWTLARKCKNRNKKLIFILSSSWRRKICRRHMNSDTEHCNKTVSFPSAQKFLILHFLLRFTRSLFRPRESLIFSDERVSNPPKACMCGRGNSSRNLIITPTQA